MLNIYDQKSCCVREHRGRTRVRSSDYHVKQNYIQTESELTEDGNITNTVMAQHKKDLDTIIAGGWDLFFLKFNLLSFIYFPGLMFCFFDYFSRYLYIIYIKARSSFVVIIFVEL